MIRVRRYTTNDQAVWDECIAKSANGTFILKRPFMDYHNTRFIDHSLLLLDENAVIGVFPASENKKTITSHAGLTYGGLILRHPIGLLQTLACFYAITRYYHQKNYATIVYKSVPAFFHTTPIFDDQYALFLLGSSTRGVNTGFVRTMREKQPISKRRLRQIAKAQKHGITIRQAHSSKTFWETVLVPHLKTKFGTRPVHTVEEIELLRARFPDNIVQFVATKDTSILAGVTLFVDRGVAHAQYIASTEEGRQFGALDQLFWHLITNRYKTFRYVSFGTTNMGSTDGRALSPGLVTWKEGFGTRMFPYTCYTIQTKNYPLLSAYKR